MALRHKNSDELFQFFFKKFTKEKVLNAPIDEDGDTLMHITAVGGNMAQLQFFHDNGGSLGLNGCNAHKEGRLLDFITLGGIV